MKKSFLFLVLLILNLSFLISNYSIAFAIEVGGHISEDTIWSPENNPYLVIDNIYVDAEVTLTIQPGTEVKIQSALLTNSDDYLNSFYYQNGNNAAKMFWVDGRIIAEGTDQDSIVFTRMQDDFDYYWGCLYMSELSELSIFKYCKLEYSGSIGLLGGNYAKGVLTFDNGYGVINNNTIANNSSAIKFRNSTKEIEIKNNTFYIDNVNDYVLHHWIEIITLGEPEEGFHPTIIANNYFNVGFHQNYPVSSHFIHNTVSNATDNAVYLQGNSGISYYYNNQFQNCNVGIGGGSGPLYIKNNLFIGGGDGIDIDEAYVEISDNYFEMCDVYTEYATGKVYNNIMNNGEIWTPGDMEVFNNICYNNDDGYGLKVGYNPYCTNNISINNEFDIWSATVSYENCVIIKNDELTQFSINGEPLFRNCIIDFELEYPLIDGGDNIIVDSLQAQSIFEDIQNGDFHLIPGSIAIDAGYDTLGYYYPFDMDFNHRVWDGDNNGTAIIDIGPYEYGAPAFGGIEGVSYDPITGNFVDYVLIKINNEPGEFTFSDSIGSYEYKIPAGVYDVYAERVFYDDAVEYQVEVIDGEFTQLDIPMYETVDVQDYEIIPVANDFNLSNFPNPFNPTTTITYSIPISNNVELSIFNIKGQKITTLFNEHLTKGKHSIVWSGCDQHSNQVSSGIYFYKLKVGNQVSVKRMLLLK